MKSNVKSFYIILIIKIMLMNVLLNMRMFGLFSETSQEVTTYRILAATRIEIALLETIPLYGQGEKCA